MVASITLAAAGMVGCSSERAGARGGAGRGGALEVQRTERGVVRAFVYDTLSPAGRILRIVPERGDGASTVCFTFADSARGVSSGLGLVRLEAPRQGDSAGGPPLVWPDSVTAAWWTGPHAIAFTTRTGRGVYAVGDVRADKLVAVLADSAARARSPSPPPPEPVPPAARARAIAFVDSAQLQPAGKPAEHSALRYVVRSIVAAPGGDLVAFYTVATDSTGGEMNPSWHLMELPSGSVATVDSVVGPVDELQESAGAWGGVDGRTFFWARRMALEEARIGSGARHHQTIGRRS